MHIFWILRLDPPPTYRLGLTSGWGQSQTGPIIISSQQISHLVLRTNFSSSSSHMCVWGSCGQNRTILARLHISYLIRVLLYPSLFCSTLLCFILSCFVLLLSYFVLYTDLLYLLCPCMPSSNLLHLLYSTVAYCQWRIQDFFFWGGG